MKADKTEYMCFNQKGNHSTLNGGPLKLVDKFTYQGCSVSSTENDVNISKRMEKKLVGQLLKNRSTSIEQVLEATSHKAVAVRPLTTITKLSKLDEPDMRDTAVEVGEIS